MQFVCNYGRKNWNRSSPNEEHQQVWLRYDKILCYRSNLVEATLIFQNFVWLVSGQARYQASQRFLDDDGACNRELVLWLYPYLKAASLALIFLRLPKMFLSCWKLDVCKYYLYYQVLWHMVIQTMPFNVGDAHQTIINWNFLFMYWAFSFSFKSSMAAVLVGHAWCMVGVRHLIYEDPIDKKMILGWIVSALWIT